MGMKRREFVGTTLTAGLGAGAVGLGWPPSAAATKTKRGGEIRPPEERFLATLPGLMEIAQLPGIGIGVVQRGKPGWKHYEGFANADTKTPITAESVFPAASLSKQVFAYLALGLLDEGRLELDKPLREYVKEDAPTGPLGEKITARHVLSHSSGLRNWRWEHGQEFVPAFEPGTKFRYSGEGFYYLMRCVERITGTGFEALVQERVMKPMGMNSSTYLWQAQDERRWVAGHDRGSPENNTEARRKLFAAIEKSGAPLAEWNHDRVAAELMKLQDLKETPMPNNMVPNSAASLLTTVNDYGNFLTHIVRPTGAAFEIKAETRAMMMKPQVRINKEFAWGLGWGIQEDEGWTYLWQWGDNGEWKNFVLVHPESASAIVVFTNGDTGMRVAERVVRAATGRDEPAFLWL
jgi:CubicO group peptidase (beta-lactamase class C family)